MELGRRLVMVALAGIAGGCTITFPCSSDDQCTRGDKGSGVCEASGYCSFPDDSCDSDQRYGELAPAGLAGRCVPAGESSSTADSVNTAGPTDAPTVPGMTTADPSTSSGIVDGADSSDSSITGGPVACCHADCEGACIDRCDSIVLGGPAMGAEAIGVAVVGEWVVWSTGFGQTLELASLEPGIDERLADVVGNSFVTKTAADDSHVYFVDYGGPTLKRATVPEGLVETVSQVPGGEARFGGLAVGAEHVYFAMRGTGGIWRAAKDLSDQLAAESVYEAASPFDIVLDEQRIYWIDGGSNQVRALELDAVGPTEDFVMLYDGSDLTTLAVDDDFLFVADGGSVVRTDNAGADPGLLTLATQQGMVWDMAVDEVHVYWTSASGNTVVRARKDGTGGAEVLANTEQPWGLALGCDAIFWAQNGTQTLQRRLK
ncbi:MAG: hypothetical protein AAGF11_16210 [Myxococcota bacterium]